MSDFVTIGVDLGGTKMAGAIVEADGSIRTESKVPRPTDQRGMTEGPLDLAAELMTDDVAAIGIGVAGLVRGDGTMVWGPNVPGEHIPFGELARRRFGVPVVVDNDANLAALGEARVGAAAGYRHSIMITLGTGIGGGLILDGELYRGSSFAGEIGHITVDVGGPTCTCGQRGCWETFASGRRLDQIARDVAAHEPSGLVATLAAGEVPNGTHITAAALEGDPTACRQLAEMGTWLGIGIANLIAILDPERIVIGGAVSGAGDLLLEPARRAVADSLEGSSHRPEISIVGAELGAAAGMIGAALAARDLVTGAIDHG